MIADTIIREGEVAPKDIVLYAPPDWSLAFPRGSQETIIFLWASETQAQSGADATDIVVTRIFADIAPPAAPTQVESKFKRRSGSEWTTIGTIIVSQ